MAQIALRGLSKSFGPTTAVAGLDLTVPEGAFVSLLGPSGCGKTTILRLIAGFEAPTTGRIEIGGRDVTPLPSQAREVGIVFQSYALFPHLTVFENVAYGLRVRGLRPAALRERVGRYMELVELTGMERRRVSELSGGQQQRVALARSLAIEPQVLLLDEPLSNLDARLRDAMRAEIRRIHATLGRTTVYVTHDQAEALSMSDRIAVFQDGHCRQEGTPAEIYARPADAFVARFVGESNILSAEAVEGGLRIAPGVVLPTDVRSDTILIRPEAIRLAETGIPGTVVATEFVGAATFYKIDAGVEMKVHSFNAPGSSPLPPGTRVHLHVDPAGIAPL